MSKTDVSLNELISDAEQSFQRGVPVDWRNLCFTVMNVASNHINQLEAQLAKEEPDDDPTED